jgi:predicted Kef-type K+ transport protein
MRLPPLVENLLAGVVLDPFTPGISGNANVANQPAEIGIILLMFGVGLHFSIKDLMEVQAIAMSGAIAQIGVGTGSGLGLTLFWGWSIGAGETRKALLPRLPAAVWSRALLTLAKVTMFVALAVLVGTRVVSWLLLMVARTVVRRCAPAIYSHLLLNALKRPRKRIQTASQTRKLTSEPWAASSPL